MNVSRDGFTDAAKRRLAERVSSRCSNPDCRAPTSGPQLDPVKALNLGVAAHITAAAPGGPRYDPTLSSEQRSDLTNGIWLCQNCAKLVDNDQSRFDLQLLRSWKVTAESEALARVGRTEERVSSIQVCDKWVDLKYIEESGIKESLRDQGYDLRLARAFEENRFIDLDGWEHALVEAVDGSYARLKIHDHPAIGGYHVVLKKRRLSEEEKSANSA